MCKTRGGNIVRQKAPVTFLSTCGHIGDGRPQPDALLPALPPTAHSPEKPWLKKNGGKNSL